MLGETKKYAVAKVGQLRILGRYRQTDEDAGRIGDSQAGPPDGLASCLLAAAWQELQRMRSTNRPSASFSAGQST